MSIDIRLPNITGTTESQRLSQVQGYIYQLAEQLNWALNTMENNSAAREESIKAIVSATTQNPEEAQKTFDSIKALIIKSADIVESYYDQMKLSFDGAYVAQSDFGDYADRTNLQLEANSQGITQNFNKLEVLSPKVDEIEASIRNTEAWIKTGELEDGYYGIEVGERKEVDGEVTFNKYARFTSDGIYFYLPGQDSPVAWMTGNNLYIANARITQSINLGGYQLDITNGGGITFRWVGV